MKVEVITALDIGTHSVKMVMVKRNEAGDALEILGFVEEPSVGVRKGAVANPEEVIKTIMGLKNKLEVMGGYKIDEVIVSVGGNHVFVLPSRGVVAVSRADGEVSGEDVERVLQAAQAVSLPSNKEILEVFPQQFMVDGTGEIKEPVGMRGVRLEVDVLAVCAFTPYMKNLTDSVLGSGLEISDIIPSSLAAAEAVLTPRQKEMGVAVIDIGAGTTGLSVYEEGDLVHTTILPVGAGNITHDIAIGLRTEPDIAEYVKIQHGSLTSKGKKSQKIQLADGSEMSFSPKFLSHIIEARMKQIFQFVNKELKQIGKQGSLPAGIVLTGGGSKLPGVVDMAKKELKVSGKVGVGDKIVGFPNDSAFLGVMGLILSGAESGAYTRKSKKSTSLLSKVKKVLAPFIP